MTKKFILNSFLIILVNGLFNLKGYSQKFIEGKYPLDLNKTTLIVEQFDSTGKTCEGAGNKKVYCSVLEKDTDTHLELYRQKQAEIFKMYKLEYVIVSPKEFPFKEYNVYKDTVKFRYILKMVPMSSGSSGGSFVVNWVFYFHDRKTGEDLKRIINFSSKRFKPLEELVEALNSKF
jgi:hypothetical protein